MANSNQRCYRLWLVLAVLCSAGLASAQEEISCYGPGSIATSVVLTFIFTVALVFMVYFLWKRYKLKRGKTYTSAPKPVCPSL